MLKLCFFTVGRGKGGGRFFKIDFRKRRESFFTMNGRGIEGERRLVFLMVKRFY